MPLYARDTQKNFTPAPEGLHHAVCVDVIDVGLQDTPWGPKMKVALRWELDLPNPDRNNRPYLVTQRYSLSLNEKATLRRLLEAWRGRRFTEAELAGFDLEALLGVNCQLQIVHNLGTN